jgi:type IV pilus assembly protein PilW
MRTNPVNQRGMGLISLMIALTIGTFLLAGLFDIWFQTRRTFTAQAELAQLQDNQRMALTIMANTVQTGGYFPYAANYPTAPNPPYSVTTAFPVTTPFTVTPVATGTQMIYQAVYGTSAATATTSDTLWVRYQSDGINTLDCLGQTDPVGTIVVNTYQIDANGNLQCSLNAGSATPTWQTVITGIAKLTILYGVDTVGDYSVHQYMTATTVTADNDWAAVRSVNIQLTFNNPLYGQPGQTQLTLSPISRIVAVTQTTPSI